MVVKDKVIITDNKSLKEYSNRKFNKSDLEKRDYIHITHKKINK